MNFIARRLVIAPDTFLTVLGTILMSLGINFLSNSSLYSGDIVNKSEIIFIIIILALTSIFLGATFFAFIQSSRKWEEKYNDFIDEEKPLPELKEVKEKYIMKSLETSKIKKATCMLRICCLVYLCASILALFFHVGCGNAGKSPDEGSKKADLKQTTTVDSKPIRIGYQQTALYRHLFTALEKAYFVDEGLKVEAKSFVSANQMFQAMISGDLDAAGLSNLQVMLTVEGKDPDRFKMVNALVWKENSFPDYILVRKDTNIKTLKELEAHTVGLHPGSAVKAFSRTVLEKKGVDIAKIKFLELEPPMMKDAILAKRIDGIYCMDPEATLLVENGICNRLLENPMKYIFEPPVPISGTVISKKFIISDSVLASKLIRALDRAILYMREAGHEEEIAGYISKYTPITKDIALKMNKSEYWTFSEMDNIRMQQLADRFYELKIVEKQIKVDNILIPGDFLSKGNL
jgi:ABC-type nitrate/sulfonate/bicarbonate transport system substrate-binding protein